MSRGIGRENTTASGIGRENTMLDFGRGYEQRFFQRNTQLAADIFKIRTSDLHIIDRLRGISMVVDGDRKAKACTLIHADDDQCYLLWKPTGQLFNLDSEEYKIFLTGQLESCGSERDGVVRYMLEVDKSDAMKQPRLPVHTLAYYDEKSGRLAVSDGERSVWRRERYGNWEELSNGDDGLFFFTDGLADPWIPDFDDPKALAAFTQSLCFDPNVLLKRQEQETLLQIFLLSLLFPPLARTRVIPTFLGPKGSGKTSAVRLIGRLFQGAEFDVTSLNEKNEDDYIAAICNSVILGLDNADSRVEWLEDDLAIYATGYRIRKRKLYTTNQMVSYKPRASLLLSSRDPHFRRDDVSQRLLQLYFCPPEAVKPEANVLYDFCLNRGKIMGALLSFAGLIADALAETPLPASSFRMADFAAFGHVAMMVMGRPEEWPGILRRLTDVQAHFATEGNPVVETLAVVLERSGGELPATDTVSLYQLCNDVAPVWAKRFFKSARSFSQVFTNMMPEIERELNVKITISRESRKRIIKIEKAET
jgi:hypothetical protein